METDKDTELIRSLSIDEKGKTFIKIILTETEQCTLYESPSETVPVDSEDAEEVQRDNERYKYLTEGKGRNRRLTTAETSTSDVLFKTRGVNTEQIKREDMATFVSNYDMFDTYEDLATKTTSLEARDDTKIVITTYLKEGEADPCELLMWVGDLINGLNHLITFIISVKTIIFADRPWFWRGFALGTCIGRSKNDSVICTHQILWQRQSTTNTDWTLYGFTNCPV